MATGNIYHWGKRMPRCIRQCLEKTDQIACSSRRSGGLGGQEPGAAHSAVGASPRLAPPGQAPNRSWAGRALIDMDLPRPSRQSAGY